MREPAKQVVSVFMWIAGVLFEVHKTFKEMSKSKQSHYSIKWPWCNFCAITFWGKCLPLASYRILGNEPRSIYWQKCFLRLLIKYYGNSTIPEVPWVILILFFSPKANLFSGLTTSGEGLKVWSRRWPFTSRVQFVFKGECIWWSCVVCVHVRVCASHACALVRMTEVVRRGMMVGAMARRRKSTGRRIHKEIKLKVGWGERSPAHRFAGKSRALPP